MCRKPWRALSALLLEAKKATVEMAENVADELLTAAVKDAGYEPVDCKAV